VGQKKSNFILRVFNVSTLIQRTSLFFSGCNYGVHIAQSYVQVVFFVWRCRRLSQSDRIILSLYLEHATKVAQKDRKIKAIVTQKKQTANQNNYLNSYKHLKTKLLRLFRPTVLYHRHV